MTVHPSYFIDDDTGSSHVVLPEILNICSNNWPENDFTSFVKCYHYVTDFFIGNHPDFPYNLLPYHNLRHTRIVTLATARLLNGLFHQGQTITAQEAERALICALFHDTGLLKISSDVLKELDCANHYTVHEQQSARILRCYAQKMDISPLLAEECGQILNFTNIKIPPKSISCSDSARKIGHIVGTTDIVSQMADRYYLECLPLLYTEMTLENYNQFSCLFDLFYKTKSFYTFVLGRLQNDLGWVYEAFNDHFYHATGERRNLYMERIEANLNYLDTILADYDEEALDKYLRRIPPHVRE